MKKLPVALLMLTLCLSPLAFGKTYLFILSGQSNMQRLDSGKLFTPIVKEALAPNDVIVVKFAKGGEPIMRWYKNWQPGSGQPPATMDKRGDFYDIMMDKVKAATEGKTIDCVTFVWMQGERDAKTLNDDVYEASFKGLVKQIEEDLGTTDINVVYGRLSDRRGPADQNASWDNMRELQVAMAEGNPHWEWVDTDDLNGEKNDIHYIGKDGYTKFGQRLAEKSLELIKKNCD